MSHKVHIESQSQDHFVFFYEYMKDDQIIMKNIKYYIGSDIFLFFLHTLPLLVTVFLSRWKEWQVL